MYVNTNNGLAFGVTALTIGGLAGGGMVNLATTGTSPSPVTLSVDGNNSIATYSGVLSGGGGLTQAGTGTQILTGANTYTGATTITPALCSWEAAARPDRSAAPAASATTASWPLIFPATRPSRRPSPGAAAWFRWRPAA